MAAAGQDVGLIAGELVLVHQPLHEACDGADDRILARFFPQVCEVGRRNQAARRQTAQELIQRNAGRAGRAFRSRSSGQPAVGPMGLTAAVTLDLHRGGHLHLRSRGVNGKSCPGRATGSLHPHGARRALVQVLLHLSALLIAQAATQETRDFRVGQTLPHGKFPRHCGRTRAQVSHCTRPDQSDTATSAVCHEM